MAFKGKSEELYKVYFPQPYTSTMCITKQSEQTQCIWGGRNVE